MKHVIIGTAGHVDHGKTTLIYALTGTDTDRLPEEKERGMTLDLGFAQLRLPNGTVAGIVDVPGHERFLKNMLAGIGGVDIALLVVASDEGVMPQTLEHLAILNLLEIKQAVVALTKMDAAQKEWTDLVEADLRERLLGTPLAGSPFIRVSAKTGKGIDALKRALLSASSKVEPKNADLPFRLPVDRAFTRPGFGTVVTGTLVAGTLHLNDLVEILPSRHTAKVRQIQVHGQTVKEALAGSRVAVNLAGADLEDVERGTQLAFPGTVAVTETFSGTLLSVSTLPFPVKDRARVRLSLGTEEVIGRLRLLEENTLAPDRKTYIRFLGEKPFAALRGDRFILRTYSPLHLLGGGLILETSPAPASLKDGDYLLTLKTKERGTPTDLLEILLARSPSGVLKSDLPALLNLLPADLDTALLALQDAERISILPGERLFSTDLLEGLKARLVSRLEAYHARSPLKAGQPREELKSQVCPALDSKLFGTLLGFFHNTGDLVSEGTTARLPGFTVQLGERQAVLLERIRAVLRESGLTAPPVPILCEAVNASSEAVEALLKLGIERKWIVKAAEGVYYDCETVEAMKAASREIAETSGTISVSEFRDRMKTNRKFAVIALELLDTLGVTRRDGDHRILL